MKRDNLSKSQGEHRKNVKESRDIRTVDSFRERDNDEGLYLEVGGDRGFKRDGVNT